jgi:hypothetical protein
VDPAGRPLVAVPAPLKPVGRTVDMGGMFRVPSPRRELYGLCLGVLLLANLAGGAAVVVARATGPEIAPAASAATAATADPTPGVARPTAPTPTATDAAAPNAGQADCGQGSATAQAVLDRTESGYVLRATVANNSNRTVELDRLAVRAVYADGARTFTAAAAGHWISSGVAGTDFALPDSTSATPPVSFAVTDFAFHTAGRPGCAAR